jgi:hypothetical protein
MNPIRLVGGWDFLVGGCWQQPSLAYWSESYVKSSIFVICAFDYADEETSFNKQFSSHKMMESIDFLMKTYIISNTLGNLS